LGGSARTSEKNAEALVDAGKEIRLEVNTGKSKYMVRRSECRTMSQYKHWKYFFGNPEIVQIFGKKLDKSKFYSGIN